MIRFVIPAKAGIHLRRLALWLAWIPAFAGTTARAADNHCLTLYGSCKYAADFTHFDYTNPDAPKGGSVKLAEVGSFDNLNPFILKGVKAPGVLENLFESLMTQSMDEPMSMYGLIAESVSVAPDHGSVEFTLRKEAHWHDGSAITPDDVVFSFTTLKEKGDPSYKILYTPICFCRSCEKTGTKLRYFPFFRQNQPPAAVDRRFHADHLQSLLRHA